MNSNYPSFSVIIIAYDRQDYLLGAVKSVLKQDYHKGETEIIVVKAFRDEETDATLAENGVRNIYMNETSIGLKFRVGIMASKNEIICFLEDDDLFLPSKLSTIASIFMEHPNIDLTTNRYSIIDLEGTETETKQYEKGRNFQNSSPMIIMDKEHYDFDMISLLGFYFNNSRICLRRDSALKISEELSRVGLLVDALIPTLSVDKKFTFCFVPEVLNRYRIRPFQSRLELLNADKGKYEFIPLQNRVKAFLNDLNSLRDLEGITQDLQEFINFLIPHEQLTLSFYKLDPQLCFASLLDLIRASYPSRGNVFRKQIRGDFTLFLITVLVFPVFLVNRRLGRNLFTRLRG